MAYLHYFCDFGCPNCNRTTVAQLLHAAPFRKRNEKPDGRVTWTEHLRRFRGLFSCASCRHPVTLDISLRDGIESASTLAFLNRLSFDFIQQSSMTTRKDYPLMKLNADSVGTELTPHFRIDQVHPNAETEIPDSLPENILRHYRENILGTSAPTMMVIGCRIALEAVCREKTGQKDNLFALIEKMAETGVIPESIKEWAHTIRAFGNSAAHDPDNFFPDDEAEELKAFTRMLLEFIYSHPARIERLKSRLPNKK